MKARPKNLSGRSSNESAQSMFSSLWSWASNQQSEFCRQEFPKVFAGFIDHLTDTLHAQGAAFHPSATEKRGQQEPLPLRLPAAERLVAIGDIHGDFEKARRAFQIAGLIDKDLHWSGGTATAVQVGDQLDRGGNEVRVLYFLERLQKEAQQAGGSLHILNGNHETLNTQGSFRYVTKEGVQDFIVWKALEDIAKGMKTNCNCRPPEGEVNLPSAREAIDTRRAALAPGGSLARRFFAPHPVILQIGSTVFVHGGILPKHTEYGLERMNQETRAWFLGESGKQIPAFLAGKEAIVWARDYSTEDKEKCNCTALRQALQAIPGAQRMVVGHTIQDDGINTACDNQVYRIDVGLSKGCGNGDPEVLEILNDKECRSLHETKAPKVFAHGSAPSKNSEDSSLVAAWWQWWGSGSSKHLQEVR